MPPYAINDLHSLYVKSVKIDKIKAGAEFSLTYDRCLKPTYEKMDEKTFVAGIVQKDRDAEQAGSPSTQRIRVEIHDEPELKVTGKVWSQSFTRTTEK